MALSKKYSKDQSTCQVTFSIPVSALPEAEEVRVLGDFNNWDWEKGQVMTRKKDVFSAKLKLETGRNYEFRYFSNQSHWENDWEADNYVPSPFAGIDNSVVRLPSGGVSPAPSKAKKASKTRRKKKVDLTIIEGVGPKISGLLAAGGFASLEAVAKADPATLKEILEAAGSRYSFHNPATWPEQAALAVAEDWDGLK
ncbi:MAG: helix-hairpin-helix domain-containing protein, partial [Bacteroidota bacterium]